MPTHTKDELTTRLEDLEDVTLDDEYSEVENLIDSGDYQDAEDMIDDLENDRL